MQCGKDLEYENKEVKVHNYPIVDSDKYNIAQHFEEIYQTIREASKTGGVLVDCFSGISRSPAIVIAYLMRAYLIDYEVALKRVKSRRFLISPSEGFTRQLRNYEKHIKELRELRKKPKEKPEPQAEEKVRYVSKSPARARGAAIPIMNTVSKEMERSEIVAEEQTKSPKTQKSVTGSSQSLSKYDPDVIKNIYGKTTK